MGKTVKIWYLYHSGFAVELNGKLLVFDYYLNQAANNEPVLYNGKFSPEWFENKDVYFFASHRHFDHFNPIILRWAEQYPNIRLILSSDIKGYSPNRNIYMSEPEKKYAIDDLYIETYTSTDEGVAFLVKTDGVCLFHAGDLHWWHWEGEPDSFNKEMEQRFKEQIEKLASHKIDIAFIVVDPRQENYSTLGLDWFVKKVECSHIFPLHFSDDLSIMDSIRKFKESGCLKPEIHIINKRGQLFDIHIK